MSSEIRVAELFAGVGGFRLGLDGYDDDRHPEFHMDSAGPYHTVWANQWEPDGKPTRQFAWECYEQRFGKGSCVNEDIAVALDKAEQGDLRIPDFDMAEHYNAEHMACRNHAIRASCVIHPITLQEACNGTEAR